MNIIDSSNPSPCRGWLPIPKWIHTLAWGGVLALVLLLIGLSRHYDGRNVWQDWPQSPELQRPAYAERIYPADLLRTRADTWSNLAFVLIGLYGLGFAVHDSRRKFTSLSVYLCKTPALSFLFGAACCYLGFGSGFFHASLTRWGQQLDVAAMYAPLLALIAINVGDWIPRIKDPRNRRGFPAWPILTGLVLIVSFLLYQYKWSMNSALVLPTLILVIAILSVANQFQRRRQQGLRWLGLGLVTVVAARVCWQLDVAKKFSGPDAWFQGHAVWHLLTALSLASMYLFYRTESRPR